MSKPTDVHEREADQVANRMSAARLYPATRDIVPHIRPFSSPIAGEEIAPASVDRALAGSGSSLEPELRQDMEQRFGHDFSRVRIHSGASADRSARDVAADAYTVGHHIVFGLGRYSPWTREGDRLLTHELTHVVQGAGVGGMADSARPAPLMRQPASRDKTAPETEADPCTAPDPDLPAYDQAEEKQRHAILQDMLRGVTADERKAWCKRLRRAMAAFSTSQLLKMKAAGVRFWRSGEFPPPFNDEYAPSKTKRGEMARYEYRYRVIQWGAKAGVDEIRHELAHAWDHVRTGKIARLDRYKGARLRKAILAPATFSSESNEKRVTIGADKKVALSVQDTFDRFMKRPAQSYWSFANTKTDPEHVTSDVKEFYAEGYSVFHSGDEEAQARLLCDAPELFLLLEKESKAVKLPTPDRGQLMENNTSNNRKCASVER